LWGNGNTPAGDTVRAKTDGLTIAEDKKKIIVTIKLAGFEAAKGTWRFGEIWEK